MNFTPPTNSVPYRFILFNFFFFFSGHTGSVLCLQYDDKVIQHRLSISVRHIHNYTLHNMYIAFECRFSSGAAS
jgi:hypothetical protein